MNRHFGVVLLALLLGVVSACGRDAPVPPAAPHAAFVPLAGLFRAPTGEEIDFQIGGRCLTTHGSGTFTVDGTTVRIVMRSGDARVFQWVEPDVLRFDRTGLPPELLYREGSMAAQRPEALEHRKPAERPVLPEPDPSVPLTQYQPITTPRELSLWFAAHAPSLTEDEKLALIPETAPADAFARRDFLAARWPSVEAQLIPFRTSYVRFDVAQGRPKRVASDTATPPLLWMNPMTVSGLNLAAYDLDAKRFPLSGIECLGATSVAGTDMRVVQLRAPGGPTGLCALPVPDESVARAIEANRSRRSSGFPVEVQVYAFVQSVATGRGQAIVTHASLSLFLDRTAEHPLVTADLPL